jgi:hypothetical protein
MSIPELLQEKTFIVGEFYGGQLMLKNGTPLRKHGWIISVED